MSFRRRLEGAVKCACRVHGRPSVFATRSTGAWGPTGAPSSQHAAPAWGPSSPGPPCYASSSPAFPGRTLRHFRREEDTVELNLAMVGLPSTRPTKQWIRPSLRRPGRGRGGPAGGVWAGRLHPRRFSSRPGKFLGESAVPMRKQVFYLPDVYCWIDRCGRDLAHHISSNAACALCQLTAKSARDLN